jgi:hypothetical protein
MAHLAKDRQFLSSKVTPTYVAVVIKILCQKLTSDGNADSSNAVALLYVLHSLGPTKDVTMCN